MKNSSNRVAHKVQFMAGASFIEYILILTLFGLLLVGASSFFQSSSEQFYENSTSGLMLPYPPNYIPEPTPSSGTPGLEP